MNVRLLLSAFSLLAFAAPVAEANEEISLRVSPILEPLQQNQVPLLHEAIPEALVAKDGLDLILTDQSRWDQIVGKEAHLRLQASIDASRFDKAILTLWNWNNQPVSQSRLLPGHTRLSISLEGKGAYLITLDGYRDGQYLRRLVRNTGITEDLNSARAQWKSEEYFLGVCAFPGRYHWTIEGVTTLPSGLSESIARELEADLIARLGFQVVRVDESMEMGQRSDGKGFQFNFDRMDASVDAYTSRGLTLALQIMNSPEWAILDNYADQTEHLWRYPREEIPQRHYVKALLERYGQHARFVQIFNEPDQTDFWSGTPQEYVSQFRFSYDEVRQFNNSIPVVNGGYCQVDPKRTRFYVEQLKEFVTLPAYHSHGHLPKLIENFSRIKQLHEQAGYRSPRFLNTETGQAAWRADQERRMGQFVPQKTLYCWANQHAGILLFAGRMTLGPKRHTQDFGFLNHYFGPRFVYGSMASLVSSLAGASYHSTLSESDQLYVYEFKRENERILAAFTLNESGSLRITSDARSARAVDAMGNALPIDNPSVIELELDGYPRYVVLEGASRVSI